MDQYGEVIRELVMGSDVLFVESFDQSRHCLFPVVFRNHLRSRCSFGAQYIPGCLAGEIGADGASLSLQDAGIVVYCYRHWLLAWCRLRSFVFLIRLAGGEANWGFFSITMFGMWFDDF